MRIIFFICTITIFSCSNPVEKESDKALQPITISNKSILSTDGLLRLENGIYKYKNQLFSGFIQTNYPTGKTQSIQSFYNGKDEGWANAFFESGNKQSSRFYHLGEKDSVHTGWWNNGNIRFIYHFKNGMYNGDFKEFYVDGKPLKQIFYINGKDSCGQGWRENGKPFMNYVTRDGRRFGLMNTQLCYSLKKEQGKYIK